MPAARAMGAPSARTGLLGGSFDPPHAGHLRLAELAWERLGLDELRFVPAARAPHKDASCSSPEIRERLLRIALRGRPWSIDPLELERGGTSYTVDTLEALARREPGRSWILLLGSDQAAGLPAWRRPDRIWELASVAAALRPGQAADLPGAVRSRQAPAWSGAPGELVLLPSTDLELSSSALRRSLALGEAPEGLAPEVLAAIRAEALYR